MKSICYTHKDIATLDRGGLCVLFKTLAAGMVKKGWKVSVITTQEFQMPGVTTYNLDKVADPFEYSKQVSKVINLIKPDIVECSNWRYELLDFVTQQNNTTKTVVRCDPSCTTLFPTASHLEAGEKKLCQKADLLLAVSQFSKDDIENKYEVNNIKVIRNGINNINKKKLIDSQISSGEIITPSKNSSTPIKSLNINEIIDSESINVIWIGKPTLMKGFDLLEKIVEQSPSNIKFIINIGYASSEVNWKSTNYDKCLFLQGLSKEDQLKIFSRCNVFLSTSRTEGFGIVVSESLELGIPVLLNKSCKAFHEFIPNSAVNLIDINNVKEVIKHIIKSKNLKSSSSLLPKVLKSKHMIDESEKSYLSLI